KKGVVTGTSRGLGREILLALCGEGASVVGLARNAEAGGEAAEEANRTEGRLHETSNALWDDLVATHLTGAFWGCKHALEAMRADGTAGSIVNIGSILSFTGDGYLAAYTAMKSGVLGLTKAIAIDYALDGIRCNCICPGDMETPMIEQYFDGTEDAAAARAEMEAAYPGKRIAHPREVAMAAVFLVSDESSFVNGTPILVDGGLTAKTY